jgi:hypothetical protein
MQKHFSSLTQAVGFINKIHHVGWTINTVFLHFIAKKEMMPDVLVQPRNVEYSDKNL